MPGENQKVVTIPLHLWEKSDRKFNSKPEYWSEFGVTSITGLISYLIEIGLDYIQEDYPYKLEDLQNEVKTIKETISEKLKAEN